MILIHSGWMPKTKAAERHLHSAVTPGPGPRPSSLQTLPLLPSGPETPRGALLRLSPYCVGWQALNLGFSIKDIGQVPSFRRFRAGVVGTQRTSDMPHSSHVMRRDAEDRQPRQGHRASPESGEAPLSTEESRGGSWGLGANPRGASGGPKIMGQMKHPRNKHVRLENVPLLHVLKHTT